MAGKLLDTDPQLAYAHAEAARRRAARLPVTREATGEAAYAAGEYAVALNEFRALRRMSGGEEYLAAMADCERALGRPERALALVREGLAAAPDFAQRVELRLVEAGARLDMEQPEEALRLLKNEIESSGGKGSRLVRARLRYGYADLLERTGDTENAERWFAATDALDAEGETDAADRLAVLQGMVLELDEDDLMGADGGDADGVSGADADDADGVSGADAGDADGVSGADADDADGVSDADADGAESVSDADADADAARDMDAAGETPPASEPERPASEPEPPSSERDRPQVAKVEDEPSGDHTPGGDDNEEDRA
ncbi:hypothetical protein [Nigerium massiliense]|uniref:hypothetical protein n=1 Tax=Nigerium massiliense TaxID=1522317 RepID=UPI0011C9A321|nr:hypothetical protein [Nigerium massiliense]